METILVQWAGFKLITALLVFCAYLVIDALYAYYTLAVTQKKPFVSATVGASMHFLIAFGVLNYTENYLYVIPIALGSWVGTFCVVTYDLKKRA
jgi:hypothetical protein